MLGKTENFQTIDSLKLMVQTVLGYIKNYSVV